MKNVVSPSRAGLAVAAALMIALGSPAFAQTDRHSTTGQEFTDWSMPKACTQRITTASEAASDQPAERNSRAAVKNRSDARFLGDYMAEMQEMQGNFPTTPSGDPDVDFARVAIPHHQGLLEASLRYLESGEDKMIRKLAELFIVAQRGQVAVMCDWLEKHHR